MAQPTWPDLNEVTLRKSFPGDLQLFNPRQKAKHNVAQKFVKRRWPWLAASLILTVALFVATTLGWLWYVDQRDSTARQLSLDLLWLEQSVTQNLNDNEHMLGNWARDLQKPGAAHAGEFLNLADGLIKENPALIAIDVIDKNGRRVVGLPNYTERPQRLPPVNDPLINEAIQRCLTMKRPVYSRVIEQYAPLWVLALPVSEDTAGQGVVLATYDLDQLLATQVPWWFVQRYDLALLDRDNKELSPHDGDVPQLTGDFHKLNFGPDNSGLSLRAAPHASGHSEKLLIGLSLAVLVAGLLIIWLLRLLQRWLRERLAAQQALANELHFREAMEQSLVTGLLAFDIDGRIIYVNPALCQMLGLEASTLIGSSAPFPFWPKNHLLDCSAAHAAMLAGDNPEQGRRLNLIGAGGSTLSVRLFASPLTSEGSNLKGWMASLYDTTELQKEREALASSREQLYAVLSGLDAAVCVSQISDGKLLFRNRRHADLFRFYAAGECCLICWPGLPQGSEKSSVEFQDRQSGNWYHLERRKILWVDDSPVLLDIATDITARREAANTARERDELLQHTARLASLAEFASGIAHELNQPLAAISNYSAVASTYLDTTPLQTDKIREAVHLMSEESDRAGKIIHSMRSFIQKRSIQHDLHDLADLLKEPLLLLAPLAERLNIRIAVQLPDGPIQVECDAVMIEQVLFNLIRNALEAVSCTNNAELVDAVLVQVARDADNVTIRVSDRGPGIQDPGKLFQPFYTTKQDGMGLGLAICRTVIESHGGRLWADNNPQGGACFQFRLSCIQRG